MFYVDGLKGFREAIEAAMENLIAAKEKWGAKHPNGRRPFLGRQQGQPLYVFRPFMNISLTALCTMRFGWKRET